MDGWRYMTTMEPQKRGWKPGKICRCRKGRAVCETRVDQKVRKGFNDAGRVFREVILLIENVHSMGKPEVISSENERKKESLRWGRD